MPTCKLVSRSIMLQTWSSPVGLPGPTARSFAIQAIQTKDPVIIRQAQMNIAQRRAGLRTPMGATPHNFATPQLAGSLMRTPAGLRTPASTPARTGEPIPEGYARRWTHCLSIPLSFLENVQHWHACFHCSALALLNMMLSFLHDSWCHLHVPGRGWSGRKGRNASTPQD